jgi:hypothetical protein
VRKRFDDFHSSEWRMLKNGHPFFVATLFQPELSALSGTKHPFVTVRLDCGGCGRLTVEI